MTWVVRRHVWMSFRFVFIWCQMSMNSSQVKPWKRPVSAATNTWWRIVVKIPSICVWDCIHSMLSGLTKCCHVLELIGKFCYKSCFVLHSEQAFHHCCFEQMGNCFSLVGKIFLFGCNLDGWARWQNHPHSQSFCPSNQSLLKPMSEMSKQCSRIVMQCWHIGNLLAYSVKS